MKIRYFLSIFLAFQCPISMHSMARVCNGAINIFRNSRTLLPTLTKHTSLFAKSLHTTLPTKNIPFLSHRLFQQIPYQKSFNKKFVIAGAGLSLWGYNKVNSMTVHAQEEKPKYSKEMVDLFNQFKNHLQKNNMQHAGSTLLNMTGKLKEDGDYNALAKCTNFYIAAIKETMIQEAMQAPKDKIENIIKGHIQLIFMANGMTKGIEKKKYLVEFPEPSTDIFLAIRENEISKQNFLEAIEVMKSQTNDKVSRKILKAMKKLLMMDVHQ